MNKLTILNGLFVTTLLLFSLTLSGCMNTQKVNETTPTITDPAIEDTNANTITTTTEDNSTIDNASSNVEVSESPFQNTITSISPEMIKCLEDTANNRGNNPQESAGMLCERKLAEQKRISKIKACEVEKNTIGEGLEVSRPKEKTYTPWFYKNNNKLFYPVAVSSGGLWNNISSYFYVYDCQTKKASDISQKFLTVPLDFSQQTDFDEGFHILSPMILTGDKLLFSHYFGGISASAGYSIIDPFSLSVSYIDINSFIGYKEWEGGLNLSKYKNITYDGNTITDITKEGTAYITRYIHDSTSGDLDLYLGKAPINLLTKTITVK